MEDAVEKQRMAEVSLQAVTKQYSNLEASYDDLLERNRGLEVQIGMLGGSNGGEGNKKSD